MRGWRGRLARIACTRGRHRAIVPSTRACLLVDRGGRGGPLAIDSTAELQGFLTMIHQAVVIAVVVVTAMAAATLAVPVDQP
jgi:hypothetical protein